MPGWPNWPKYARSLRTWASVRLRLSPRCLLEMVWRFLRANASNCRRYRLSLRTAGSGMDSGRGTSMQLLAVPAWQSSIGCGRDYGEWDGDCHCRAATDLLRRFLDLRPRHRVRFAALPRPVCARRRRAASGVRNLPGGNDVRADGRVGVARTQ